MQPQFTIANGVPVVRLAHMELTCEQCGRVFFRKRSKVKSAVSFCSNACKWLSQRRWEPRPCEHCGSDVPRGALRHHSRYCSRVCFNEGRRLPIAQRLWRRVRKTDGCWIWTGQLDPDGYGRVWVSKYPARVVLAHRLSYRLAYGPIPDAMMVCHHCDVPRCVRPDHLFVGTALDNAQDAVMKGRHSSIRHRQY
jgi:hypothetical protein